MARAAFVQNPALVAIAVNYSGINRTARGYIADEVAPRIPVPSNLFRWWKSKPEEAFTVYDTQIDRLGRANEIVESFIEDTGQTVDHALREPVPYGDEAAAQANSVPFPLKAQAVRNVIDKLQLRRETRVAALAMSTSSYSAGYIDDRTAGVKWSDYANSDPVKDVIDAIAKMIFPGSVGICSLPVANILRRHPKVSTALGGTADSGRYVSLQEIATIMGLSKIVVGNTLKQTSKRGQNLVTSNVWPDSFAIHYQGPVGPDGLGIDIKSPNFLTTFQWGGIVSSETTFDPGDMGLWGGVKVLTGESVVEKQISPFAGYLFNQVL